MVLAAGGVLQCVFGCVRMTTDAAVASEVGLHQVLWAQGHRHRQTDRSGCLVSCVIKSLTYESQHYTHTLQLTNNVHTLSFSSAF